MKKEYRQGDVLLVEIDRIPDGAKLISEKKLVLAYGEVTGHSHVLTAPAAKMWSVGKQEYVSVGDNGLMSHEDHVPPIAVEPGAYEVIHQREYTPKAPRRVTD